GSADRARVPRRVLAGVARPVARVRGAGVAVVSACRPRRALGVGRTARAGSGAHLREIAVARRRATDREAAQEAIRGAGRARPRARLGLVALSGAWPADHPGVPRRVLASVARSVALIRAARVAVVRARRAGGTLRIRRAAGARPGAVLRRVALAARRPTDGARRLEGVGGADRARPRAVLVDVARARGGPADGARVARRVLAGAARAVALVAAARVSVVRAGRARRALCVGRTRGRRPGAALGRVAFARRPATHDEARLEHVGGTGRARPRTVLVNVTDARRRAADRAGV